MGRSSHDSHGQKDPPHPDRLIADLAGGQHGVVSTHDIGTILTRGAFEHRVRSGRLHRIHDGVYAVGCARLSREGVWLAAVLACGPDAVLSHRDAGALWGIRPSARRRVDVTTPHRGRKGRGGIDLHRVRRLDPDDVTEHDGVPVTTPARTLVDLAELLPAPQLERAVHEAEVRRVFDLTAVRAALGRADGRRRAKVLADLLATTVAGAPARGGLELPFLQLCRDEGLPLPAVNTRIGDIEVDFLWAAERLVVETDGAQTHLTRHAFEEDRRRDAELTVRGFRVVRFTWDQVTATPDRVAATVRALLG